MKILKKLGVAVIAFILTGAAIMLFLIMLTAIPVSAAPKLNKRTAEVTVGKTIKLSVKGNRKKVRWSSLAKNVATVNSKGVVKGKRAGIVKIVAKIGKKKLTCKVRVRKNEYSLRNLEYSDSNVLGYEWMPTKLYYSDSDLMCEFIFYNGSNLPIYGFRNATVKLFHGKKEVAEGYFKNLNIICEPKKVVSGRLIFDGAALPKKKADLGAIKRMGCSVDFGVPIWYTSNLQMYWKD